MAKNVWIFIKITWVWDKPTTVLLGQAHNRTVGTGNLNKCRQPYYLSIIYFEPV